MPSSKSSEHGEAVELPGPSRAGFVDGQIFSYTQDGILLWPKLLDTTLFDCKAAAPRSTTSHDTANVHLLLVRDMREMNSDRRQPLTPKGHSSAVPPADGPATLVKQTRRMISDIFGVWYLCLPDYSARYHDQDQALLQAYGALVMMRRWMGLTPDETAFRALIVACGRNNSPHRSGDVLHIFQELKVRNCPIREPPNLLPITFALML